MAKAYHLPYKFKGYKEEKNKGKKEGKKEAQEVEEGVGQIWSRDRKEGKEEWVVVRRGSTIHERMVVRWVGRVDQVS